MTVSPFQFGHDNRGSVTIELVFGLMVFLFLTFGIIEFGSMVNERNALTQVAREGASLASRNLTTDANMLDLLESTENALNMAGNPADYRIFLAKITGGFAGNPMTCVVSERGGLASAEVEPPVPPNCDLPATLVNYVTEDPGIGTSPVEQFTVVKVYYRHNPITPFGNLDWFGGDGTNDPTIMWSEAIF